MDWDLGSEGLLLLAGISAGFAAGAALLVGGGWRRRGWALVVTAVACFGVGLFTSEWLFGWATEEDLQPNVDGLSRDEVLLSSLLTTVVVVVVMRVAAAKNGAAPAAPRHLARHVEPQHLAHDHRDGTTLQRKEHRQGRRP